MDNPVLWVVVGVVGVLLLIFLFRMARGRQGSVAGRVAVEGFAGGSAASLGGGVAAGSLQRSPR
jgi:hypothetical protein